jgi:hypothetical protein
MPKTKSNKSHKSKKRRPHGSRKHRGRNLDYHHKCDSYEGRMIKSELYKMINTSKNLYKMLEDGDDLPEWVNKKIFNANMNMSSVYDYLSYKIKKHDC